MNKLLVPNGGMPLFGDDFGFLDTANRDAFKGIIFEVAKLYSGNMILGGCELTIAGANFTVASGYLMIAYEVCYFAGFTGTVAGGAYGYFALNTSFDSAGLKSFANGSSQNTWQLRTASFTPNVLSGGALDYTELFRFSDGLEALLTGKMKSSTSFTMIAGWAKVTSNTPTLYKHFRNIDLVGDLTPGTISQTSFTKITTLPSGFRPVQRFKSIQAAFSSTSGVYGNVQIEVFTNGEVYAIATGSQVWDIVSLNLHFTAA